jgi:hypothetical protein
LRTPANTPGVPTHELGSTIDLVFANVPLLETEVVPHLYTGSDHYTLLTTIPGTGVPVPTAPFYRLRNTPESRLIFSRTVRCGLPRLPDALDTTEDLNHLASGLGSCSPQLSRPQEHPSARVPVANPGGPQPALKPGIYITRHYAWTPTPQNAAY